jgi:hypothetical protein
VIISVLVLFVVVPAAIAFAFVWYMRCDANNQHFELPPSVQQDYWLDDEDNFGIDISEDYYREHGEV